MDTVRKRRGHSKSKNGCVSCKRRHQKCDETQPICGECRRLEIPCSFNIQTHTPLSLTAPALEHSPLAQLSPTKDPNETSSEQNVNVLDLEIFNNFIHNTTHIVVDQNAWGPELVNKYTTLGFSTPYLLHSFLAMSAIQLFLSNTSRKELLLRASYLQSTALTLAQPHLNVLSPEQSIPMLFFSAHTAVYSLAEGAFQCLGDTQCNVSPLSKLLGCFKMMRGIKTMIGPHWRFLRQSWAGPILDLSSASGHDLASPQTQLVEHRLLRSLALGLEAREERSSCLESIDRVLRSIEALQRSTDRHLSERLVYAWVLDIDPCLEAMMVRHKPVALIILAYYAVLLKLGHGMWWVSEWPDILLHYIDDHLGEEWTDFLAWPKGMILASEA